MLRVLSAIVIVYWKNFLETFAFLRVEFSRIWFEKCLEILKIFEDNELKSLNYQNSFISVNITEDECLIPSIGWSLRCRGFESYLRSWQRCIRSWSFSKRFSKFQDIFRIKFWKIQLSKMQTFQENSFNKEKDFTTVYFFCMCLWCSFLIGFSENLLQ